MADLTRAEPPYLQIAASIREQILDGRLGPGDTVPSTRALMEEWSVSKATATRALTVLADEGLTIGQAGRGTVVRSAAPTYRRARDRYQLLKQTGKFHQPNEASTITAAEVVPPPPEVRAALGLNDVTQTIRRHRVTRRDGEVIEVSTSWFDAAMIELAPALLSTDRIPNGTTAYVAERTGRKPAQGQETSYARLATSTECDELERKRPLAVLVTEHIVCDAQDQPITYEVGVAPSGHKVIYNYAL